MDGVFGDESLRSLRNPSLVFLRNVQAGSSWQRTAAVLRKVGQLIAIGDDTCASRNVVVFWIYPRPSYLAFSHALPHASVAAAAPFAGKTTRSIQAYFLVSLSAVLTPCVAFSKKPHRAVPYVSTYPSTRNIYQYCACMRHFGRAPLQPRSSKPRDVLPYS